MIVPQCIATGRKMGVRRPPDSQSQCRRVEGTWPRPRDLLLDDDMLAKVVRDGPNSSRRIRRCKLEEKFDLSDNRVRGSLDSLAWIRAQFALHRAKAREAMPPELQSVASLNG